MMVTSAVIALFSVWIGLTLSYHLGTAGSATMALTPIVIFFLVLAIKQLKPRAKDQVLVDA